MKPCAEIRQAIQERLDGPVTAEIRVAVETHVRFCAACQDYHDGMIALQDALRVLPDVPFPEESLEAVWDRTIRARGSRWRTRALDWRIAAAAAAIVTALFLPALFRPVASPYTSVDLQQARQDARKVLALTAEAFRKTREAAVDQVLTGEVSPAVRKIPIRWSRPKQPDSRRPRT